MNQMPINSGNNFPMPANLGTATAPVISQPTVAPTPPPPIPKANPSTLNPALTKVLLGIIPLLIFTATGIISYSMVNNKNQQVTYQSNAKEITQTPKVNGNILPIASISGCIFSMRYDATESASLKTDALTEITKIKTRLENQENSGDVMFEVQNGMTKTESVARKKEYFTDRNAYLLKYKNFVSPFAKFQVTISPNFCFANTSEINNNLGDIFYTENQNFITEFNKIVSGKVSNPFPINKSTDSGAIDYGWMIIKK